ncbi:MAG: RdgB/HAM1 family non-canonical purine NTP pyrophosphatase [Gemmatimonadota bacterium]
MRLLLATRSPHKAREVREILATAGDFDLVSLADLDLPPSPEEDDLEHFETFRENALAKARYFAARTELPVLADDSGLRVEALDGDPGVRTKRFSGRDDLRGHDLDLANNALLLDKLSEVPDERRNAYYVCAAVLVTPQGGELTAIGTFVGRIAHEPRGSGGFGYDPIFLPLGPDGKVTDHTVAELTPEAKNRLSHRGKAFRALAGQIQGFAG